MAAILTAATLVLALTAWCSVADGKRRLWTGIDKCMAMPVYAGPDGPLIGYLIGGALVNGPSGPMRAIDVSVIVDGKKVSVWRSEVEVRHWWVRANAISSNECRWTSPDLLDGKWSPAPPEVGLGVRLWHRFHGDWTTHHGLLTFGDAI